MDKIEVSIHAPVRGATNRKMVRVTLDNVSIHAPVRGATITRQHAVFTQLKAYNSRKANKGLDYHLLGHPFFSFS